MGQFPSSHLKLHNVLYLLEACPVHVALILTLLYNEYLELLQ